MVAPDVGLQMQTQEGLVPAEVRAHGSGDLTAV